MSINLHIHSNDNNDANSDNGKLILSPLSTAPSSPDPCLKAPRKSNQALLGMKKYDNFDKNTIITYKFYKTHILPRLLSKKDKIFIYKSQVEKTMESLNLKFKKGIKKNELELQLFNYFNRLVCYDNEDSLKKINLISKNWKIYKKRQSEKIYGPGFQNKKMCKNDEDCFTFETIDGIPDKFFFSIRDALGDLFFFDVRTFFKLYKQKSDNPYTRQPFTNETKETFKLRYEHMQKQGIDLIFPEEQEYLNNLTPTQKINNKVLDIFGDIDRLNVIAGGTKIDWFKNLNIIQLKKLYKVLEDVWNYRAELTNTQKNEIVPGNIMFPNSINYVFNLTSKIEIQNIILNEMEKLVKSSPDESHQHTGAYYILISLTEISYECAQDLPWLIQY
jgi:hypothetical protein